MLTLSMIVKDEENYLRGCLDSVKDIVDEIVVVDTGSADSTVEIAKEYGARVLFFEWVKDFSAARNYGLEHCKEGWILYLDADERLKTESKIILKELTKATPSCAYYCNLTNIDQKNNKPSLMAYPRLFPNVKNIRFEGKVHEQIAPSILKHNFKIKPSSINIEHIGYDITTDKLKLKAQRNLDLLLNDYKTNKNSYIEFQIGQSYSIIEEKEKTILWFKKALADTKLNREYRSIIKRFIGIQNLDKGLYKDGIKLLEESIREDDQQVYSYLALIKALVMIKEYTKIYDLYVKAYKLNCELAASKNLTAQSSYFKEETIIYDALSTSVIINNKHLFNYFHEILKSKSDKKIIGELNFIDALFNGSNITSDVLNNLDTYVNKTNIKFIVELLAQSTTPLKEELFEKLYNNYNSDTEYLLKYGLYLITTNKYQEASEILETALQNKPEDPSIVFYLISALLKQNKLEKIKHILVKGYEYYSHNLDYKSKLDTLTLKLQPILNTK